MMLSILEARELAIPYDAEHSNVGVSYNGGFTDEWVIFAPIRPEHEGCPGYVVNRLTGEVDKNCAMNFRWIRPITNSPDFTLFDLEKDADSSQ